MDIVNSSTNSASQTTEMYVKKVLAGKITDVRTRIIVAAESLGYDIIEDEPHIIGRRGAKSWATWFGSADVLDYPMTLTVRLKSVGENSTRVTFDYIIKHPMLNAGEKNVVVQEAKTLAAISKMQAVEKMCSVCETDSTDDSRFCRRCGAPLTSEQAELEVLRMTAETRAGHTSVMFSAILSVVSVVLITLTLILSAANVLDLKGLIIVLAVGLAVSLLTAVSSLFGRNRLVRSLNKSEETSHNAPGHYSAVPETGEFETVSPPRNVPASITEGTTNLLDEEWMKTDQREKVPVSNRRNTNNLE